MHNKTHSIKNAPSRAMSQRMTGSARRSIRRARTRRSNRDSNKTYKCNGVSYTTKKKNLVSFFMEMINTVKIYHWNTHSYAQHKATDELFASLNEHVDNFIETLLGKKQDRLTAVSKTIKVLNLKSKKELVMKINKYIVYLEKIDVCFSAKETDLLNIRDEIMGDLNKFKYLLTLE